MRPDGRHPFDVDLLDQLERVARVVREVLFLLRLEVRGQAFGVAAVEDRLQRGAARADALEQRIGAEEAR